MCGSPWLEPPNHPPFCDFTELSNKNLSTYDLTHKVASLQHEVQTKCLDEVASLKIEVQHLAKAIGELAAVECRENSGARSREQQELQTRCLVEHLPSLRVNKMGGPTRGVFRLCCARTVIADVYSFDV